jgi:hypothetical protein
MSDAMEVVGVYRQDDGSHEAAVVFVHSFGGSERWVAHFPPGWGERTEGETWLDAIERAPDVVWREAEGVAGGVEVAAADLPLGMKLYLCLMDDGALAEAVAELSPARRRDLANVEPFG